MVSAGHYLAAHAGFEILESGGNAIDAGCAAGIALGVLQSDLVNVAGVAPIIIYHAQSDKVITNKWSRDMAEAFPRIFCALWFQRHRMHGLQHLNCMELKLFLMSHPQPSGLRPTGLLCTH